MACNIHIGRERSSTTAPNKKRKKKEKNWYVEQLSFCRMYYDDWLCYYSTTQLIEAKEEKEWKNEKEIVDSRAASLPERIRWIVSRHRCCKAKKTDNLMEMVDVIVNDKDNRLVSKRRKKQIDIRCYYCTINRLFNRSVALLSICFSFSESICLHFLSRYLFIYIERRRKKDATHLRRAFSFHSSSFLFFFTHIINHYDHK